MSQTNIATVTNQIQKFWSPMFMDELRQSMLIGQLVNKEYDGQIRQGGDTVYVSQINAPAGELRTVGTDADAFATDQLSLSRVAVQANKRAIAAYEFDDLSQIQSQIGSEDSEIRKALVYTVGKKINDYIYSLVAPSTSAPDHLINSVTNFDKSQVSLARMNAAIAKWGTTKPWYCLADPSYYSDMLNDTTLANRDYVGDETPIIAGQMVNKRFGLSLLEDNGLATDQAVVFHPDFLHLVTQTSVQFKISDLHVKKQFGFVISADLIFGAALGIDGAKKHQVFTASSSAAGVTTI